MAKIKKKGVSGQAKNFITRTQAVRKLQVSLSDFRRLCIFKGIYPREPRNKKKAAKKSTPTTTFYYTKDIQYLLHEPILNKFRDYKALSKKIAKSLGRGEISDAARLERNHATKISLDHIIKERYPTFMDALRDLDDALSMLFLFANLPSTAAIPPKTIRLCQRLCHEFQLYIITSHSLRKSFLSIKGIYYQASIQGQDIMWLVPYKFVQRVTEDVDFRIMGTFIEFYTTLLGFVNFRLYSSIGLVYPPRFNASNDERGAEMGAFSLEGIGIENNIDAASEPSPQNGAPEALSDSMREDGPDKERKAPVPAGDGVEYSETGQQSKLLETEAYDTIDSFEVMAPGGDVLPQPQISSFKASKLFSTMHVYISRESPRQPLEFVLKSFGCERVSFDPVLGAGTFSGEKDSTITHQIVDRPSAAIPRGLEDDAPRDLEEDQHSVVSNGSGYRFPGRTYVQPQWVWDSVNAGELLRPDLYAPGAVLPPHLSPWVKPKAGAYDPLVPLADQEPEGEAEEDESNGEAEDSTISVDAPLKTLQDQDDSELIENGATSTNPEVRGSSSDNDDHQEDGVDDEFGGFDEEDANEDNFSNAEIKAEAGRQQLSQSFEKAETAPESGDDAQPPLPIETQKRKLKIQQDEEEIQRRLGMASRKNRKLYERMTHGIQLRDQEAANLRKKRRRIEKEP